MRSLLLLFLSATTTLNAFGQCNPDQQYAGEPLGIYPDTVSTCDYSATFTFVSTTGQEISGLPGGSNVQVMDFKILSIESPGVSPFVNVEDYITTDVMGSGGTFGTWQNTGTVPNQSPILGCIQVDVPEAIQFLVPGGVELQIELDVYFSHPVLGTTWASAIGAQVTYGVWIEFIGGQPVGTLELNPTAPTCTGLSNGSIEGVMTGGNPPFTYDWTPAGSGPTLGNVSGGTYSLTVTDVCGLAVTESVNVPLGGPEVTLQPVMDVCTRADAFDLDGGSPVGGFYTINGSPATTFDPATVGLGTHNIVYTYTDGNNCTVSTSQPITVNEAPAITILGETEPDGQTSHDYAVVDIPGVDFSWTVNGDGQIISGGQGNSVEVFWGPSASGQVVLTVEESVGCVFQEILTVGDFIGINELVASKFLVQPNPSSGIFQIKMKDITGPVSCDIIDATGRLIERRSFNTSSIIDLSVQPNGVYSLLFTTQEGMAVKRLIKH